MKDIEKKIIVVEGKHDEERIKRIYPDAFVLTTNGYSFNNDFFQTLKTLSKQAEVILFLDPDYAGERIRRKILEVCPNASHIFINKEEAYSKNKKKIGVEHLDLVKLKNSLKNIKENNYNNNFSFQDIYNLGLSGKQDSKDKRQKLCKRLNIGYVNSKQLITRLNMFNYTYEEIKRML